MQDGGQACPGTAFFTAAGGFLCGSSGGLRRKRRAPPEILLAFVFLDADAALVGGGYGPGRMTAVGSVEDAGDGGVTDHVGLIKLGGKKTEATLSTWPSAVLGVAGAAGVAEQLAEASRLGQLLGHASGSAPQHRARPRREHLPRLQRPPRRPQTHEPTTSIAGVLQEADGVNRINASAAAAERGIRVQEDKREQISGGTGATLRLTLHWTRKATSGHDESGKWTGLATVLHGQSPRLLSYDGIDIEADRHPGHHPQPGCSGRHRPHRHHSRRGQAQHRQLRPWPRQTRRQTSKCQAARAIRARPCRRTTRYLQARRSSTSTPPSSNRPWAALRKVDAITSVRTVELGKL